MSETKNLIAINRYPGVKPFSVSENFLFFGRETDLEALNTLIYIRQTVVLYGKSGYGKSSLINAGIIPRLKENDVWVYFSIRFNNYSEKEIEQNLSPVQTIKQRLSNSVAPEKNNLLDRLLPNEDSFWYWIKQHQTKTGKINFIIFFDQFEELFTYPKQQVNEFSEQLSQLLYTTLPVNFKKKIADAELEGLISNEEYNFLYEKPEIKVIFSIRSDRLSLLNGLKDKHPAILQHCYELDALNIHDAKKAITEPAKLSKNFGFKSPEFTFTDTAIEKILSSIANVQDGKIEAATLQIICRYVEDNLVEANRLTLINENDLGDITGIFQQYYQGILNRLTTEEKLKAQHLIEDELIDGNRRNPLSATYIKSKFGLSDTLLSQLEQSSLLRKERDAAGRILYEVSHDTLIAAINKVAENRRVFEQQQAKLVLEKQIEEERKRNDALIKLNKKAVIRYRLAIVLVAFSLLIAATAVYFRQQSLAAVEKANEATELAITKKAEAQTALFKNKLLQSEGFVSNAERYISYDECEKAKEELMKAKDLLKNDFILPQSVNEEKRGITYKINELMLKCNKQ